MSLVLRRIEQLLRPHLDWLLAQSEYAFGADPHVTDGLWRALKEAERHVTQELGKEYSTLDNRSLEEVNRYYRLLACCNEAVAWVGEIRQRKLGAHEHTERAIALLKGCLYECTRLAIDAGARLHPQVLGADNAVIEDGLVISSFSAPPITQCWAIVVGVDQYDDNHFKSIGHAFHDAYQLTSVLLSGIQGYSQERLRLFTRHLPRGGKRLPYAKPRYVSILDALRDYCRDATADDLLFFYFSGHGVLHNKEGYLLCQDTSEALGFDRAIKMMDVRKMVEDSSAGVKVLIFDTCHSGAAIEGTKSTYALIDHRYVAQMFEQARGSVVITSCRAGEKSFPLKGTKMSLFTYYLIEGLQRGMHGNQKYVTASSLRDHIRPRIAKWSDESRSGQRQTPQFDFEPNNDPIIADWRPRKDQING